MFRLKFFKPYFSTFLALASIIFGKIKIFTRKAMASTAMRFSFIDRRWANASQHIFSKGNYFQMIRINTNFISTEMVYRQSIRYLPFIYFIRKSMGQSRLIFRKTLPVRKIAIPCDFVNFTCPVPTTILLFTDILLKIFNGLLYFPSNIVTARSFYFFPSFIHCLRFFIHNIHFIPYEKIVCQALFKRGATCP